MPINLAFPRRSVRRWMAASYVSSPEQVEYWESRWASQFEGKRTSYPWSNGPPFVPAIVEHHKVMKDRYERAARQPWISVPPEPTGVR